MSWRVLCFANNSIENNRHTRNADSKQTRTRNRGARGEVQVDALRLAARLAGLGSRS